MSRSEFPTSDLSTSEISRVADEVKEAGFEPREDAAREAEREAGRRDGGRKAREISRRSLGRGLGLGAVAAFWAGISGTAGERTAKAGPASVSADVDPNALLTKLVRRTTMGVNEAELALAASLGYSGYLEYQLNHTAIPEDPALEAKLAALTTLPMPPATLLGLASQGTIVSELSEAAVQRAVFSKRQLFERMVEFWTDHFNIDILKELDRALKTVDDREVIRPNALGTFPDLLNASARSPAMLYYLDNTLSTAGNPNENYAREIMELHTMGVDGGYTQQDVEQVTRCFTGWTMWPRSAQATYGTFRFNAAVHDNGQKTVLGNIIPAGGGMQDGITVINILIDHPSTARYLSKKLCSWLLQEDPPQSVVNDVAAAYTATRGDIKAMIRAALKPNVLADAALKYKRPFHHFVSALRALPTTLTTTQTVRSQLNASGHHPFYWGTPDGYPDKLDYWVGLILPRWNFGASLLNGNINGASVNVGTFFNGLTTAQQMVDRIDQALFAGEMSASEKNRIRTYMLPDSPSAQRRQEGIGLAIGSPGFQWY